MGSDVKQRPGDDRRIYPRSIGQLEKVDFSCLMSMYIFNFGNDLLREAFLIGDPV